MRINIVQANTAAVYYQPLGARAGRRAKRPCSGRTLFHLTPYANDSLAPLFIARHGRAASRRLDVDRYRWRVDLDQWVADSISHIRCRDLMMVVVVGVNHDGFVMIGCMVLYVCTCCCQPHNKQNCKPPDNACLPSGNNVCGSNQSSTASLSELQRWSELLNGDHLDAEALGCKMVQATRRRLLGGGRGGQRDDGNVQQQGPKQGRRRCVGVSRSCVLVCCLTIVPRWQCSAVWMLCYWYCCNHHYYR